MSTFIKKGSKGQVRVWKIWVKGAEVHRSSGQKDGQMVHTFDTPGSAGKKGTKAFISAEDRALERAQYLIKKKRDAGYREADPNTLELIEKEAKDKIDWESHSLPPNFEVGKPLDPKTKRDLTKRDEILNDRKRRLITLKEDGLCFVIMIGLGNKVQIYSRKMEYFTDHFPYIKKEIESLEFPPKTILTCEFVIKKNGRDSRKLISQLKGKADKTVKLQEDPFMRPTAIILNCPYWNGIPVMREKSVLHWMSKFHDFMEEKKKEVKVRYVRTLTILRMDFDEACKFVVDNEHEGLVIYDKFSIFGGKAFNFRGTTERTPCYKWKPYFEADCLVIFNPENVYGKLFPAGGQLGTAGKIRDLPKNVSLYQFNSQEEDAELVFLSNCGSGFTIEQREQLLERAENYFGMCGVAEIRYASRFFKSRGDDTNALLEPIFKGWRDDKKIEEACEPKLKKW